MIGLTIMTAKPSFAFTNLGPLTTMTYIAVLYGVRMLGFSMVMMPVATAALNQLPKQLIPHGAAVDNTMKMIAASVGTAILVTVIGDHCGKCEGAPRYILSRYVRSQCGFYSRVDPFISSSRPFLF